MTESPTRKHSKDLRTQIKHIALLALLLMSVVCLAQESSKPKPESAQAKPESIQDKPRMETGELRTRLYAISQMVQTGRLDEAEQGIDLLRNEAGSDALIDGMEAFLMYRRHDFPGARATVEKALKTTKPPTWWYVLDAMSMFAMGDETAAKDTLTKSTTEDPRGTSDGLVSMVAAALHDFQQTPSVEGAMTLAFLDRTMGSRRAELNVLDQALKKFPNDPRLIVSRMNLLGDAATDPKVVIAELDKAVAAAPTNDVVQCVAGELYDKLGAFDKGLVALQKAVQLNAQNYPAHLELGNALEHEKKYTDALPQFEAIISATPPVPSSMLALANAGLGATLTELKRWKEGEDALQKALTLAPESSVVLNNIAWLYAVADAPVRNPEKAVELATKAATITRSRQPTVLDTLAEAYFAAGNRDKAVETEKRAILLAPSRADLQDHLKKYQEAK